MFRQPHIRPQALRLAKVLPYMAHSLDLAMEYDGRLDDRGPMDDDYIEAANELLHMLGIGPDASTLLRTARMIKATHCIQRYGKIAVSEVKAPGL